MTPLEDTLRAALRETAGEIPADPPPLRLSPRRRPGPQPGRPVRRRWIAWAAPLAAAALVIAVIAGTMALTGGGPERQTTIPRPADTSAGPPAYYVALIASKPAEEYAATAIAAVVRATATGKVLATVTPPKPFYAFTGVTAAADDRTFVLSAQEPPYSAQRERQLTRQHVRVGEYFSPERFFILHLDPASRTRSGLARLQALPAGFVPSGSDIGSMALSPDGTRLAATIGDLFVNSGLYVFDLASGAERKWSYGYCSGCFDSGGALGFGGVNVDAISWTADGRSLAFVGPGSGQGQVWLVDTSKPGSNLLANSRPLVGSPSGSGPYWRGAIITPDGRTVLVVEGLAPVGQRMRQQLVKFSAATGNATVTLNNLAVIAGYEQVLWTNATGSVLIVMYAGKGNSAGILRGDKYTPIPWTPETATAAW